jgi:hypothetical protein
VVGGGGWWVVGAGMAEKEERSGSLHGRGDRRRRRLNTGHLHRLGGHLAHSHGGQASLRGDMASTWVGAGAEGAAACSRWP